MALINCPECGHPGVSSHTTHCPNCGANVDGIRAGKIILRFFFGACIASALAMLLAFLLK